MDTLSRWTQFKKFIEAKNLSWALNFAPQLLHWSRNSSYINGIQINHLLPDDYLHFTRKVGFPMFGIHYHDTEGFSMLPPSAIENTSFVFGEENGSWLKVSPGVTPMAQRAFFAGYDLSELSGWAFGRKGTEIVVHEVRDAIIYSHEGSFSDWLNKRLGIIEEKFSQLSTDEITELRQQSQEEKDPHRLIDYSLEKTPHEHIFTPQDLQVHWVKRESNFGLIDDSGAWLIPMGNQFLAVKPFIDGTAEVVLNESGNTFKGPWSKIRLDGSVI